MNYKQFLYCLNRAKVEYEKNGADPQEHTISFTYEVGGATGGNCWGHSEDWKSADPEPDVETLDAVLSCICPAITVLQHRKLVRGLKVYRREYSKHGYYGDRTDYVEKSHRLFDVYTALDGMELLPK